MPFLLAIRHELVILLWFRTRGLGFNSALTLPLNVWCVRIVLYSLSWSPYDYCYNDISFVILLFIVNSYNQGALEYCDCNHIRTVLLDNSSNVNKGFQSFRIVCFSLPFRLRCLIICSKQLSLSEDVLKVDIAICLREFILDSIANKWAPSVTHMWLKTAMINAVITWDSAQTTPPPAITTTTGPQHQNRVSQEMQSLVLSLDWF